MHYYKFKHNGQEITLETIIRGLDKPFYVSNAFKYLFRYGKKVPNPGTLNESRPHDETKIIENLETMKMDLEKAKKCIEMEMNEICRELERIDNQMSKSREGLTCQA